MKMPENIEPVMFAPCGLNCMVCYKHCYHKKPCAGCLKSDQGSQGIAESAVSASGKCD